MKKRRNNIADNIKRTWYDFVDWIGYVKDQRKYIERETEKQDTIDELRKIIEKKDRKIEGLKITIETKDNLLEKLEFKIVDLKEEIGKLKKEKRGSLCEKVK